MGDVLVIFAVTLLALAPRQSDVWRSHAGGSPVLLIRSSSPWAIPFQVQHTAATAGPPTAGVVPDHVAAVAASWVALASPVSLPAVLTSLAY